MHIYCFGCSFILLSSKALDNSVCKKLADVADIYVPIESGSIDCSEFDKQIIRPIMEEAGMQSVYEHGMNAQDVAICDDGYALLTAERLQYNWLLA